MRRGLLFYYCGNVARKKYMQAGITIILINEKEDRHRERERDRDRDTERETDRQTDRERETERERDRER